MLKDALLRALRRVDFEPEIEELFLSLANRPNALQSAEEIYNGLFCADSDQANALQRAEGTSEECLIFTMAYLLRIDWLAGFFQSIELPQAHLETVIDTFKTVFERSYRKNGFYGLQPPYRSFLFSYLIPSRFTVGRLMFEMGRFCEPYCVYRIDDGYAAVVKGTGTVPEGDVCVLKEGDSVLHVHIGAKGKLLPEEVERSFAMAKRFFAKYFPNFSYRAFTCSSWLLDKNLETVLPAQSNILKFQKNFQIVYATDNNFSLYWHIFGIEEFIPPWNLVPKNDFQKRILDYVLSGHSLYNGKGYIIVDEGDIESTL